jgi:hypothetical protein
LFACLGRVVTIGVLSVATLRAAAVTTPDTLSVVGGLATNIADDESPDKEATLDDVEVTGSRAPLALGQAANAGPMCYCKSGSFRTDPISLVIILWLMVLHYSWDFRPIIEEKDVSLSATCKETSPIAAGSLEDLVESQQLYLKPN